MASVVVKKTAIKKATNLLSSSSKEQVEPQSNVSISTVSQQNKNVWWVPDDVQV